MAYADQPRHIIVYGNLAEAALRERSEALLVVYGVAVEMKRSSGAHGIPNRALIDRLRGLGLFTSRPHVQGLLKRGHGVFWSLKGDRVWLIGVGRLARDLDARRANAHRQLIPIERLRSRADRRAALLSATLPQGTPIRQRSIRRTTGVSERTQRRYRAAQHFAARRQNADLTPAAPWLPNDEMRRFWARGNAEHGVYVLAGGRRLMKRLPNAYFVSDTRLRRGRRSKELFAGQPLSTCAEGTLTVPRVFFDQASKWVRCRRIKLGTDAGDAYADPYNLAYVRAGANQWEAVA